MDNQQFIKDQIDRYLYQVSRYLSGRNKDDIEKEIRSLIDDMLDARCQGREPAKEDMEAVFAELGRPGELAAKYNDSKRYLVGPALFPIYSNVLKVVVGVVIGASVISNLISIVTGTFSWMNFGSIFGAALSAFSVVTIIFALIEWKGISVEDIFEGKMDDIFDGKMKLPPVPDKKARIPKSEPIVGLIFSGIFVLLFVFAPQYFGFWASGNSGYVSVFDIAVIKSITGLFLLCFATTVIKEIFKLIEGRFTIRFMIVTILCNVASVILIVYIFRTYPIWNQNFPSQFLAAANVVSFPGLQANWTFLTETLFLGILIFGTAVETLSCIVKTLIYGIRSQEY